MKIGVVREIKNREYRVALMPDHVQQLTESGHHVLVESNAGIGSGFSDDQYRLSGAQLCNTEQAWACDLVVKVKEPLVSEYGFLRGQMLFTYLHLAGADPRLTQKLLESKTTALTYETMEDSQGRLPLLAPMSAIAGNMATQMGSYYLARSQDGKGVLLGRVQGVGHGKVLVIGDGVVGQHAAAVAAALGAEVTIAGLSPQRLSSLRQQISPQLHYIKSSTESIAAEIVNTDLLIGAVLCHGQKAPYVVSEAMVKAMQSGSVIVDVSIDQGGCVETSRPTTHDNPVFIRHEVVHYCVTNMPGAYPRTATIALTTATWPYIRQLADKGLDAIGQDTRLQTAVNTMSGYLCNQAVADSLDCNDRFRLLTDLL